MKQTFEFTIGRVCELHKGRVIGLKKPSPTFPKPRNRKNQNCGKFANFISSKFHHAIQKTIRSWKNKLGLLKFFKLETNCYLQHLKILLPLDFGLCNAFLRRELAALATKQATKKKCDDCVRKFGSVGAFPKFLVKTAKVKFTRYAQLCVRILQYARAYAQYLRTTKVLHTLRTPVRSLLSTVVARAYAHRYARKRMRTQAALVSLPGCSDVLLFFRC